VSLHATGLFLGIMLWAYAMWWMVVAAASVVDNLRHLSFNLGWWGSVFPTGKRGKRFRVLALCGQGSTITLLHACGAALVVLCSTSLLAVPRALAM
jgi:tellurite resistance protein TehA-like permease